MALISNSFEWSLKCNSDDDVLAETLLGLLTRLSTHREGGGGGGGEGMHYDRKEGLHHYITAETEILNEMPKPAVSGLSFDTIS